MKNMTNTQFFQVESGPQISAKDILEIVYKALSEKGYNPVNQIVGYIMSGDPTYITSHNGINMCHWHIAPYQIFTYCGGAQGHSSAYEQVHAGLDLLSMVS